MKCYRHFIVLFFIWLIGFHCAGFTPKPPHKSDVPTIKVLLLKETSATVRLIGDYSLIGSNNSKTSLQKNKTIRFDQINGAIQISISGEKSNKLADKFLLKSKRPNQQFVINDKNYLGDLSCELINNQIHSINIVDLETYLKGVVPFEIGRLDKSKFEATKAQAIASRTYALKKIQVNKNAKIFRPYDILAGISDQVYNGNTNRHKLSDSAIERTSGQVIAFENKLIDAFYHSTCGGKTEFGKNAFTNGDRPYLRGVSDNFGNGDFCENSPHYRWKESIFFKNIEKAIQNNNEQNSIKDVVVTDRFQSGRIRRLAILSENKTPQILIGNNIRQKLRRSDGQILRSALFRIAQFGPKGNPDGILLIGAGNGHGVGMCQWGAIGMAKQGFNCEQILYHYYRGTKIKKVY